MEKDIIIEGFKPSENMHGLRYTPLIADGDSTFDTYKQKHFWHVW